MNRRTHYATILTILLLAFIGRVVGQLLVSTGNAPYLPPMQEWQSGLLPYPVLVACQFAIIALYGYTCLSIWRSRGFFARRHETLGNALTRFGAIYFTIMLLRYPIYMSLVPEARWLHGTIPIAFHLILASFILVLARFNLDERIIPSSSAQ